MKSKFTNKQIIREWEKVPVKILQDFYDEGDFGRDHMLLPAINALIGDVKGKTLLDAGSGNGYLSRLFAKRGAKVTSIEPVGTFLDFAIEQAKKEKLQIDHLKKDLSGMKGMKNTFDIIVANMVFMNIPDWEDAMRFCINATRKNGIFLFSIIHPCFEMSGKEWRQYGFVKVREYFAEYATKYELGHSFHRTLSQYINFLSEHGCYVEKMIEPKLTEKEVGDHREYAKNMYVPSFLVVKTIKK